MSPLARRAAWIRSSVPSALSLRASVSDRIRRSVSACALPRPSATASAKFANSTVRASQAVIDQSKTPGCAIDSASVTTVPISTTNMTGFLICTLGSSLRTASTAECARISRSNRLRFRCGLPSGLPAGVAIERASGETLSTTDMRVKPPGERVVLSGTDYQHRAVRLPHDLVADAAEHYPADAWPGRP